MKSSTFISAALMTFSITTASAQTQSNPMAGKLRKAIERIVKRESTVVGNVKTTGMDLTTTKPSQTTTYTYDNGGWLKENTTKTEYNSKGYVTATETTVDGSKTRLENTYDEKLEGMITKTTSYTWDEATSQWTNPTVVSSVELTRDSKGRVTKEVTYTLDETTNKLEKDEEVDFGYSAVSGKMSSISTTIEEEEEDGQKMTIPVKITILKWYKYNENKLFNFSLNDMENGGLLNDKENMIESGTITMTISGMPLTGTIKGEYTDDKSTITVGLMGMNIIMENEILDKYGSNRTTVSLSAGTTESMSESIVQTNNELGDCIRIETTETGDTGTLGIVDSSDDLTDIASVITMDYEYLETTSKPAYDFISSDNGYLKKSMTVNKYDENSKTYVPVEKITYDEYVDFISGTTGIDKNQTTTRTTQNKAFYTLNGKRTRNIASTNEKDVYIVKDGDKTYKVLK